MRGNLSFDDIYNVFRKLGFQCKGVFDTNFHPKTGMPLFADAIFVKNP